MLERASLLLTPGKRYGLIGRNGKGKSTLLKALAARRIGGFPETLSLHYFSQTSAEMGENDDALPSEVVLRADVERTILEKTIKELEALSDGGTELSDAQHERLEAAHERMQEVDGDSAFGRVTSLLKNLGFSDELLARPVKALIFTYSLNSPASLSSVRRWYKEAVRAFVFDSQIRANRKSSVRDKARLLELFREKEMVLAIDHGLASARPCSVDDDLHRKRKLT